MIGARWIEAGIFLSLATALHAAVWAGLPGGGGSAAQGGGASAVTASADMAALAATWSDPPEVSAAAPDAAPQPQAEPAPEPASEPVAPSQPAAAPPDLPQAQETGGETALAQFPSEPPSPPAPEIRDQPKVVEPTEAPAAEAMPQAAPAPARAAPVREAVTGTAGAEGGQQRLAAWAGQIRARVERRKTYPAAARAAGLTGTVVLSLSLSDKGDLVASGIAASSGHAELDRAALNALGAAGKFPAAPEGLSAGPHAFTLPVTFSR